MNEEEQILMIKDNYYNTELTPLLERLPQSSNFENKCKSLNNIYANDPSIMCSICMVLNVQGYYSPYGHLCSCVQCAVKTLVINNKKCPVCRQIASYKIGFDII